MGRVGDGVDDNGALVVEKFSQRPTRKFTCATCFVSTRCTTKRELKAADFLWRALLAAYFVEVECVISKPELLTAIKVAKRL